MDNILLEKPSVRSGLGTSTLTIGSTGFYNLRFEVTENIPSSLSIVVNQNGSPIYTSAAFPADQSTLQFKLLMNCTATDVITVALSSAAAIDNQLNTVKSIITIGAGY